MSSRYYSSKRDVAHAYMFGAALMAFLFLTIFMSVASSGPLVLGRELNTNGMVEYLCLGNGCENLNALDW